jgi:hypothetical protein
MLPMRRATSLFTIAGLSALTVVGCKNQSTPLTNPFLSPDRVPPPQTRVLTPGTAQPYYPGDQLPGTTAPSFNATMATPAGTAVAPPATMYQPPSAYLPPSGQPAPYPAGPAYPISAPVTPTTPTTSPNGWNSPPPVQGTPGGTAVNVPKDQQQLRFASAPVNTAPRLAPTPVFTPNAGSQSAIRQAAYDEAPASGQPGPQQLQIREVNPVDVMRQAGSTLPTLSTSTPSRDGFRPQSTQPKAETPTESPLANGFRSPSLANGAATGADSNARYGVGPAQEWLRGQLEYWPTNGEWSIHYMPDGQVDQIGGRILIDNPQVLGNLPPGEFVVVQGQVFGHQIDEGSYRPAYRVSSVQRQRQ